MIRRFTLQALRTTPLVTRQTLIRSIPKPLFTSLNLSTSSKSTSHSLSTPSEGKLTAFESCCVKVWQSLPVQPRVRSTLKQFRRRKHSTKELDPSSKVISTMQQNSTKRVSKSNKLQSVSCEKQSREFAFLSESIANS